MIYIYICLPFVKVQSFIINRPGLANRVGSVIEGAIDF